MLCREDLGEMFVFGLYTECQMIVPSAEFMRRKASESPRLTLYMANITLEDNTGKAKKNTVSDFTSVPENCSWYSCNCTKKF